MNAQPEFVYVTLVLPSLFAITLIAEGVNKILKHESGWISMLTGTLFLTIVVAAYFMLLRK